MSNKIPPYGKHLALLIKQGVRPKEFVRLYIGEQAWEKGKEHYENHKHTTLVLPYNDLPGQYSWPVKQCNLIVEDTNKKYYEDYVTEIILTLHKNGADNIWYICPDRTLTHYHH